MAGAKTRFGFSGSGSEPPDSDAARTALTVVGRDIHLQLPLDSPASSPPPSPQAAPAIPVAARPVPRSPTERFRPAVPVSVPTEETEELPSRRRSRPGGSRLAKFLGRWTRSGRFVTEGRDPGKGSYLEVPRDTLGRKLLVVLTVALVTFSLTLLGVKLRQSVRTSAGSPVPVSPAAASPGGKAPRP
jgi:hypothetical protein